ncbi:MAG: hypothetical protein OEY29_09160 [Gammaproteobacteria bacterium]|nr:hypothetical protein [Gammaproteobacteria bacterium]
MNVLPALSFIRIMGLLSAPQDLPYSKSLLRQVLFIYFVSGLLVLLPGTSDLFTAVVLMLLDLAMLTGFLKFCLYTRNTSTRFLQTFIACLGVGVLFQLLALPLVLVMNTGAELSQANNALGALFYFLLLSWQVTVIAHILRHAMNMQMTLTLLLSFSYVLLVIYISNQAVILLAAS